MDGEQGFWTYDAASRAMVFYPFEVEAKTKDEIRADNIRKAFVGAGNAKKPCLLCCGGSDDVFKDAGFYTKNGLASHNEDVHGILKKASGSRICAVCNNLFPSQAELDQHEAMMKGHDH
ncbi:unnamed protein product [Urochloa humidicola]